MQGSNSTLTYACTCMMVVTVWRSVNAVLSPPTTSHARLPYYMLKKICKMNREAVFPQGHLHMLQSKMAQDRALELTQLI